MLINSTSIRPEFKQILRASAAFAVVWYLFVPSLTSQTLESYLERKKSEKKEPNTYLTGESLDSPAQVNSFYRNAFRQRQQQESFRFGNLSQRGKEGQLQAMERMIALEGPVDPQQYIVGPGDYLDVNIWGGLPLNATIPVSPEGTLVLPNIGTFDVAGKTLAEAKKEIAAGVKKAYSKTESSVTLVAPRIFAIHVVGVVNNPGLIEVSAVDRADKAIYYATLESQLDSKINQREEPIDERNRFQSMVEIEEDDQPEISLRNIMLIRGDETLAVDLLSYYATGDAKYNPRLLDGDVLVIPNEDMTANSITISGAVRLPGTFEFHDGDHLAQLIQIAQGFKQNAIRDSVIVTRFTDGSTIPQYIVVDGSSVMSGKTKFELQRNDHIHVIGYADIRNDHAVLVKGEVQLEGSFPITEGMTTLSDIISRAGGFTAQAALREAVVVRNIEKRDLDPIADNPDYDRLVGMRLSEMDKEERDYYTYEAAIRRNFVSVDFEDLFVHGDTAMDVLLMDDDEILVPKKSSTVYVFGQVARPGYIVWERGMDEDWYLERAGGVSDAGEEGETKVIKAGSKLWVDPDDTEIEPGDSIFVPRQPDRDFAYYFTAARDFLQVAVSVVTIYLLIQQIQN
ncbi:MAG: hypothetical protein CL946_08655 [Ectothiorhodospiraceae bacterium]|nr:hypothetical protein [Ectothiorhodospiraceae bacterium]